VRRVGSEARAGKAGAWDAGSGGGVSWHSDRDLCRGEVHVYV